MRFQIGLSVNEVRDGVKMANPKLYFSDRQGQRRVCLIFMGKGNLFAGIRSFSTDVSFIFLSQENIEN